ncbi:hypothetical protein [Cellulophaga sp. E6(2014)]|uniref:hypothetical protein n=1 Tax=Cellulophaga sp. E6(2014) TaxID=1495334 RepID=UPI00051D1DA5|nr:hypothetical protein [Cellulophaga sp. E6(2014)]KGK30526.1 hypothetical protein EL45_08930 [Cellulophaga sp. E6(2014)]
MANKKEVNEKTFELNITNELLNLSKSFLWYLDYSSLSHLFPRNYWQEFLKQNVLFAEGLTQEEESSATGGYDVSINIKSSRKTYDNRLLFLQYKAGVNKTRCNHKDSHFNVSQKHIRDTNHVLFTFNDAAHKKQHSILRGLANTPSIQAESVLYVFPRITTKDDFNDKVGNLIEHTSFVPVLELDKQANAQSPSIAINDGVVHKYRTSYDGEKSEVNFFFFFFKYKKTTYFKILSELICVQIERLAHFLIKKDGTLDRNFKDLVLNAFRDFISEYFKGKDKELAFILIGPEVKNYLEYFDSKMSIEAIPIAPQKYSTVLTKDGLQFKTEEQIDMSSINFQIF